MWVNRKEFQNLYAKVQRIEDAVARLEVDTQIWDTSQYPPEPVHPEGVWYHGSRSKVVSLNDFRGNDHILLVNVVTELLDKLGYEVKRAPSMRMKEEIICKK